MKNTKVVYPSVFQSFIIFFDKILILLTNLNFHKSEKIDDRKLHFHQCHPAFYEQFYIFWSLIGLTMEVQKQRILDLKQPEFFIR